jgi:hypothetical protein
MKIHLRGRAILLAVITSVMVGTIMNTAPATAATSKNTVEQTIQTKTGSAAREVTTNQARSADGQVLRTFKQSAAATATTSSSERVLAALGDGQSSATFDGLLPAGSTITTAPSETNYQVLTPTGAKLTIWAPWAVDAAGKSLPTHYTFAGTRITQEVDTTGATFPVVADPSISFGWGIYVKYSRAETYVIGHQPSYYSMANLACAWVKGNTYGGVFCQIILGNWGKVGTDFYYAGRRNLCVTLHMWYTPILLGDSIGAC